MRKTTALLAAAVAVFVCGVVNAQGADTALYFADRQVAVEKDCSATLVMRRNYGVENPGAEWLLLELLSGPSAREQLAGAADSFAPLAGGSDANSRLVKYLERTELQGGQFAIYFRAEAFSWFNNGSCGAASVLSPIQATLLPLPSVSTVQIFIDGKSLQELM